MKSLDDSKAKDVSTINLKGKTDIADYMIVATGTSGRHVVSISDKLIKDLKDNGIIGLEAEGQETAEWVLVDLYDVIVHVFQQESRQKYDIEKMWEIPGEKEKKTTKKPAIRKKKETAVKKPAAKKPVRSRNAGRKTTAKPARKTTAKTKK